MAIRQRSSVQGGNRNGCASGEPSIARPRTIGQSGRISRRVERAPRDFRMQSWQSTRRKTSPTPSRVFAGRSTRPRASRRRANRSSSPQSPRATRRRSAVVAGERSVSRVKPRPARAPSQNRLASQFGDLAYIGFGAIPRVRFGRLVEIRPGRLEPLDFEHHADVREAELLGLLFPGRFLRLLPCGYFLDGPDDVRPLPAEAFEIERLDEDRQRRLPRLLAVIVDLSELPRVHPQFTRHLDVNVRQPVLAPRLDPALQLGHRRILPIRYCRHSRPPGRPPARGGRGKMRDGRSTEY